MISDELFGLDRPTKFSFRDYFNPERVTIPQTNYRIGYFFKENYTVSIGVDYMKYVVNANQTVQVNGEIGANRPFDKTYTNREIQLTEDFLAFEHTDGLNITFLKHFFIQTDLKAVI